MPANIRSEGASLEARQIEALTAVAAAVARSRELDTVLAVGLEATLRAFELPAGAIYLYEPAAGEMRATLHQRGLPSDHPAPGARVGTVESLIGGRLEGETPVASDDVVAPAGLSEAARRLGLRSIAVVPLCAAGRLVGLMSIGGAAPQALTPAERKLLEAVGGMLGAAIDNARLLERTLRHLEQVRALWEIDRAILEDGALDQVLATIVRDAASLGGGDVALALTDDARELRVAASHGRRATDALGTPLALAGVSLGVLLESGGPRLLPTSPAPDAERALVVPLRAGDRLLGGLVVVKADAALRDDDLTMLATFGHQAAVALDRARVRDSEDRRASQLALVSGAAEIAASTLDVAALLGSLARYVQRAFNYYGVGVYVVERNARSAYLAGAAGAAAVMPTGHRVRFGSGIIGWVAEHGEYVLANDVRREPRFVPAATDATRAELAVPVRLSSEVVAVIDVESDRAGAFDDGDVVALDAIAAQIASAIRNARLFEEKVRALRNLEIVQEITNVLNSELELGALLDRIARRSVEAVRPAQMGAVLLYEDELLRVRSSHGFPSPAALESVKLAFHEGLPGTVFVSGHGRVAAFAPGDHGAHAATFREAAGGVDPTSALCVPICLPKEKLGVLLLENATSPEAFDADDLLLALTLADQAALAIGNALRVRKIVELDEHRKQYLSNVSHELRTPLTVVQGYLEALADGTAADQAPRFLRVAREQCQRLGHLIEEILEVSRLEHDVAQRHLEWASIALAGTLRRALVPLRQDVVTKGLRLREHVAPDLPPVDGDERLLHLLLLNLVENAVKFTPEGGSVDVTLEADPVFVTLSVTDTGIGIPAELHERVFEKFFTVRGGLTRAHGGAGIGLFLAKEVVAIHGGTIRVESPAAGGTRFVVKLPLKGRDAPGAA